MDKEQKKQVVEHLRKLASDIESGDRNLWKFNCSFDRDAEIVPSRSSAGIVTRRPAKEYSLTISLDFESKGE